MNHRKAQMLCLLVGVFFTFLSAKIAMTATQETANLEKIEKITGLKGKWIEGEQVFKITSPRKDVEVKVDQWRMPPFIGLTSWAGFSALPAVGSSRDGKFMVMGDLVLFQDEVSSVLSALLDGGLSVTALHNHFFFDDPKVYFMHISGEGKLEALAKGVHRALDTTQTIRAKNPKPSDHFTGLAVPQQNSISTEPIEKILGRTGQGQDGMAKFVIGREVKMACGCQAGKEMGVNTWAAFAGADDNAIVDGDFAVLESELQAVLKTLRHGGINIVAIHHHMTGEEPRTLFLHYWGRGKAKDLAKTIKNALEVQKG